MTQRVFINQFQENQNVEGIFAIQNAQLGLTRNGKTYLKCLIQDKTGRVAARMWSATEELVYSLPTDGFVHLTGQTQPYQGELQLIIQSISPITPTFDQLADLIPSTKFNIDDMFNEVRQILATIKSPSMRTLATQYLNDTDLMRQFIQAPAGMVLHHSFLGGLLEHTLNMLRSANALFPNYPGINHDITLVGIFIHDLGKCEELDWSSGFSYTTDGQLVGHTARGILWLQQKADQCAADKQPIPENALRVLHHIILSHHGQLEFGALKFPATPEAIFISHLDNLDAKMQMALSATRDDQSTTKAPGDFTDKIWALENTRLFKPDPLANESQPEK